MTDLRPCASCAELVVGGTCACPHCGGKACARRELPAAALLLGLGLAACGGGKDSVRIEPPYSAPVTDTGDTGDTMARQAPRFADVLLRPRWNTEEDE